jgi:hypothetical protein
MSYYIFGYRPFVAEPAEPGFPGVEGPAVPVITQPRRPPKGALVSSLPDLIGEIGDLITLNTGPFPGLQEEVINLTHDLVPIGREQIRNFLIELNEGDLDKVVSSIRAELEDLNRKDLIGLDLRSELENIHEEEHFLDIIEELEELAGTGFQWVGLRQPNYSKECACVREEKDGHRAPSSTCRRCMATGYVFTDYLVKAYMWQGVLGIEFGSAAGRISTPLRNLVVQHDRPINKFDMILELDQDTDTGEIRQPFSILRHFKVQDSMPLKGDSGRIEFWKCALEERNLDDDLGNQVGTNFTYEGNRSNDQP